MDLALGALGLTFISKEGYMDKIVVHVELVDASKMGKFSELEKLEAKVRHNLRTVLQIDAKVKLVEPKSLERTSGKAKRVIDMRK